MDILRFCVIRGLGQFSHSLLVLPCSYSFLASFLLGIILILIGLFLSSNLRRCAVPRGLAGIHKLLFGMYVASRLALAGTRIQRDEWNFFIRGGHLLETLEEPPKPAPVWLKKTTWDSITQLDLLPSFKAIHRLTGMVRLRVIFFWEVNAFIIVKYKVQDNV